MARIAWVIGAIPLLLLALGGAAAGIGAFDAERHRAALAARIAALSGSVVEVIGPVDLRFLPRPHIEAAGMRFAGTTSVETLGADLDLAALLYGRVEFTALRLRNLELVHCSGWCQFVRGPASQNVLLPIAFSD